MLQLKLKQTLHSGYNSSNVQLGDSWCVLVGHALSEAVKVVAALKVRSGPLLLTSEVRRRADDQSTLINMCCRSLIS